MNNKNIFINDDRHFEYNKRTPMGCDRTFHNFECIDKKSHGTRLKLFFLGKEHPLLLIHTKILMFMEKEVN